MTDPVAHALLQRQLKKAPAPRSTFLLFIHTLSGAEKSVQYLGMSGEPLRAQIFWPIAGDYLVAPRSGAILGSGAAAEKLRLWKASPEAHEFLKQEYRAARARVPQRSYQVKGPRKCR